MSEETHCPFCAGRKLQEFHEDRRRVYLRCVHCALVFVPAAYHLSLAAERREYELHENDVADVRYRKFLSRLYQPLVERLQAGASGLDFGCGPAPALATMLQEAGFEMALYDPFFFPDKAALASGYDFVCATEVVEHLSQPGKELSRLWQRLCTGGYLAIMTKLVRDRDAFATWHYKNDPTHIAFFSTQTWACWARENGASMEQFGDDVILFQRR